LQEVGRVKPLLVVQVRNANNVCDVSVTAQPSEGLTILQMEKGLRSRAETLSAEKQKRLEQLRQRLETDEKLCASLGTEPFHVPSSCVVPTEQQLADLDEHISELETEKVLDISCDFTC